MILIRSKYFSKAELNKFRDVAKDLYSNFRSNICCSEDEFVNTLLAKRKRHRSYIANEIKGLKTSRSEKDRKIYESIRDKERIGNKEYMKKFKDSLQEAVESGDPERLSEELKRPRRYDHYNKKALESGIFGEALSDITSKYNKPSYNSNSFYTKKKPPLEPVYAYA